LKCDFALIAVLSNMVLKGININNISSLSARHNTFLLACKLRKSIMQHPLWDKSVLMNAFPMPLRVIVVVLLSFVLLLIGILNLRDRASWIYSTDEIFWMESGTGLIASEVDPGGSGSRAGIHTGDHLLSINQQSVYSLSSYYYVLDQLDPNSYVAYTLLRNNVPVSVKFQLGSRASLTPKDGLRTLLAFLHLGIGFFVLIRGARLPRTFHFYLICLAAFVVYLYSWTTKLSSLDWWVYGLSILAFLFLPALFVHFCMRFPVDAVIGQNRALLLYAPGIALGLLQGFWITGHLASIGLPRTIRSSGILDHIHYVYFATGFLVGGILLLRRRLAACDLIVRQQMKWISYGALAGIVPFTLIYILPVLFGIHATFAMESSLLFLGFIPLCMGYALIHYRLMDVETIVRRSFAYFIASSLLMAVYLVFIFVIGRSLQWIAPQANFMIICLAALAIALLFAPLRNTVQSGLDRLFYKEQFEDRAGLLEFARTLSSEISLMPLSRSILERISKTFQVDKVAMFLSDPSHKGFFRPTYGLGLTLSATPQLYREDDLVDRDASIRPVNLQFGENLLHRAHPDLVKEGLYYLQDLKFRDRTVGIIVLGQLPKDKHFSTEDLDLLSALARYAAIALENANLFGFAETKALELERMKAYTENIIESINVAVLALDSGGRITSCNRSFEELFHTSRKQVVGSQIENLLTADIIASIQNVTGIQGWELKSPANIFKLYFENRQGDRLIMNLSLIPLLAAAGLNTGLLMVLDNITEKVWLEDQLLQAEKLSSIGLLAAGIAHEVNTPIAGISSYTQMLLKETPDSDKHKSILEKIEKQTFRAAEIVNGLLNFSRLNGSEFEDININQLIQDSLSLLEHQMELNHVHIAPQLDQSLPPVYGNWGKLQQVFINLFMNARDAMPAGGELAIKTGMNESMVIVDVTDTGTGISEENVKRIYDPFFTTKTTGKGTGLGLAVTYGIIQEHGGRIFVDSVPGKGTHFRLKLPTRRNLS
jgi:two-component system NtrC family sensor kinase